MRLTLKLLYVGYGVFTVVLLNIQVYWDDAPLINNISEKCTAFSFWVFGVKQSVSA